MVTDSLSRKTMHVAHLMIKKLELIEGFRYMKLQVELELEFIRCSALTISSDFLSLIKERHSMDDSL